MDVSRNHIDKLRKDEKFIFNFKRKMKFVQRDYETPCLEWQGGLDKSTHFGRIHVKRHCEREAGRNFYAHRLNYMIDKNAFIEPGEFILHQCHNRVCCNPDHFFVGRPPRKYG